MKKWNDYHNKKLADPNWTPELNGTDPDFYLGLLKEAEDSLGEDGREWFLDKFDPTKYVINFGDNWDRMERGGVGTNDLAASMSEGELVTDLLENIDLANNEDELRQIKVFYDKFLDTGKYASRIRTRLINKFGDNEGNLFSSLIFPPS